MENCQPKRGNRQLTEKGGDNHDGTVKNLNIQPLQGAVTAQNCSGIKSRSSFYIIIIVLTILYKASPDLKINPSKIVTKIIQRPDINDETDRDNQDEFFQFYLRKAESYANNIRREDWKEI